MDEIIPVILAGGSGNRLWPLSKRDLPKQFALKINGQSLFEHTLERTKRGFFSKPIIVTHSDYRFLVKTALNRLDIDADILLEPIKKNTGPAILAATMWAKRFRNMHNADSLFLALPSDHFFENEDHFEESIKRGLQGANDRKVILFGIEPTAPNRDFGYIRLKSNPLTGNADEIFEVDDFIEKPAHSEAKAMLAAGGYLWNSGIFLYRSSTLEEIAGTLDPDNFTAIGRATEHCAPDIVFLRFAEKYWSQVKEQSFDKVYLERAKNIACVPFAGSWNDLGSWKAVAHHSKNNSGLYPIDSCDSFYGHNCENTFVFSTNEQQNIVGLNLKNHVIVSTKDSILVADTHQTDGLEAVVKQMVENNVQHAYSTSIQYRPWGWFENLGENSTFKVKNLCVFPGGILSLQSHKFRAEHWVVVNGVATVTIEEQTKKVQSGESIFVPLGKRHRLANHGEEDLLVIEVQTGTYFGEDDIVRFEDLYERND